MEDTPRSINRWAHFTACAAPLGIVGNDLNLHSYVIFAQALHTPSRLDRLMIRHPLPKVANPDLIRLIGERYMI